MKRLVPLIMIALSSCNWKGDGPERLYLKSEKKGDIQLDWFFYSLVGNTTQDYVTLTKGAKIDTLCFAGNVADVRFAGGDTVLIGFHGHPKKYADPVKINSTTFCQLIVDANFTGDGLRNRKWFKK
jgi:hypothetical protein